MRSTNLNTDDGLFRQGAGFVSAAITGRKLRILHVLFASEIAGSERYCIDLANAQATLGHEVHVISSARIDMRPHLSSQITFHKCTLRLLRRLRLRQIITAKGIEVAHAHLSPGCKALASVRGNVIKVATLHVGYKAKQHAHLDGLICVNEAQLPRVGNYDGYVSRIPNWLPEAKEAERYDLRAKLGLSPTITIVGTVGRLHPSKGNDVLISAFLAAAPNAAALVIVGVGPQRAALEKLAKGDPRVHLLGYCDNVTGFLRNVDLFVSPSREESAGLAILEAMREGIPIIASATEGPSEYLRDHPVRFVEPGSVRDLSVALAEILRADDFCQPWRIDYDMEPFSRAAGVGNVLRFYAEVAECQAALRQMAPTASKPTEEL
ncbi:glycosyltransferase family 4 protein [Rhizobium tropici]|uniref:Glycosyltransferase n=1 Tax=Rhizobium tropici TaxID=398 RepID=A0A329YA96_RHITR|nr:glycosyltransferase family 4 protein [Rhizobium tropici]RAX37925.1 glycosyltransferase [Rhizobium tropici]